MGWNGSGGYTLPEDFTADLAAGPPASTVAAAKVDNQFDDIKGGLINCLTRDGQNSPSANISWNSQKITNLGAPTSGGDAANKTYVDGLAYAGTGINALTAGTVADGDLVLIADVSDSNNPKKVTARSISNLVLPDGDKGEITVSSSGATWTIDDGVVTTAKLGGDVTTAGKALLDDADAAAQRTTLGLGSAATLTAGTSANNVVQLDGSALLPAAVNPIKAWVSFNGSTASIFGSYNVSSITKNGTGDYTINFTNAIVDGNYCVSGTAQRSGIGTTSTLMGLEVRTVATGSLRVYSKVNTTLEDSPFICVQVVR